jgi:hypothetical protein
MSIDRAVSRNGRPNVCGLKNPMGEGRIQFASGPGWLKCVSVGQSAWQARKCGLPVSRWLGKQSRGCVRHKALRMTEDSGRPRAGMVRSRSAAFVLPSSGLRVPEIAKKEFSWTVYCGLASTPKASKALRTRQLPL